MAIPLAKPWLQDAEYAALKPIFDSGWLGMGAVVGDFEKAVTAFLGCEHCVAVSTGTTAIHLALETIDVRGAEVIVPSMTYAATIQAILSAGGIPVFAECRADDLNLNVDDAIARITDQTRAIVPVHYAGRPVDMAPLLAAAEARGITVVEDAAHAFGSLYAGKKIGSFGHMTCFSFDPIKTVTCGEGGAITTANEEWAERMRTMRVLGISKNTWDRYRQDRPWLYEVVDKGFRYHMSNISAAIGVAQMARVETLIQARREVVDFYNAAFAGLSGMSVIAYDTKNHVPFCYTILVHGGRREKFLIAMREAGVGVSILYLPNHMQPHFKEFARPLPITEALAEQYVSLPLFGGMTREQCQTVVDAVSAFFKGDV